MADDTDTPETPEMVERVGRALRDTHLPKGQVWGTATHSLDAYFQQLAAIAIEAMRKPTDRMTVHSIEMEKLFHGQARCGNLIWETMIDAALGK